MAVRLCEPFVTVVVSHVVLNVVPTGTVTGLPMLAPSTWNCTEATVSDEVAVALIVTLLPVTVAPPVGVVMLTVGAGGGGVLVLKNRALSTALVLGLVLPTCSFT